MTDSPRPRRKKVNRHAIPISGYPVPLIDGFTCVHVFVDVDGHRKVCGNVARHDGPNAFLCYGHDRAIFQARAEQDAPSHDDLYVVI